MVIVKAGETSGGYKRKPRNAIIRWRVSVVVCIDMDERKGSGRSKVGSSVDRFSMTDCVVNVEKVQMETSRDLALIRFEATLPTVYEKHSGKRVTGSEEEN
jgi:hypothetical protein